jgi:predicted DNA-binding protein (MmcQ/YjbR family)
MTLPEPLQGQRTAALKAVLEAYPGAGAFPVPMPRGRSSGAVMYKVMAKIFAILNIRGEEAVLVKCDPDWSDLLREQYQGIGRRSHLDPRRWIYVKLDADVPPEEVERLVARSYELVCSGLTKKQRAELAALSN